MSQKYLSELVITNKGLQSEGNQFENLFTGIMKKVNSNFKKVKPYGNVGDRKNDGFIPQSGTYYQVYAPENIANVRTVVDAVKKLEVDFKELVDHWDDTNEIKEFKFVVNDKKKGCPADVEKKMLELKNLYPDKSFKTYTLDDLIVDFLRLDLDSQYAIVGFIPTAEKLTTGSLSILSNTIQYLIDNEGKRDQSSEGFSSSEFFEKIEYNNISEQISELLLKAETQSYLLEDYFKSSFNKKLKLLLRDIFNFIYEEEKARIDVHDRLTSSIIFFRILERTAIDESQSGRNSALILISYYFVSCDIFETKPS